MFEIKFTERAIEDLRSFETVKRKQILKGVESMLTHEPTTETRNRKRLRRNKLAEWELRAGNFRVFYDVDQGNKFIEIQAVGYKRGSRLFIAGEEYQL